MIKKSLQLHSTVLLRFPPWPPSPAPLNVLKKKMNMREGKKRVMIPPHRERHAKPKAKPTSKKKDKVYAACLIFKSMTYCIKLQSSHLTNACRALTRVRSN